MDTPQANFYTAVIITCFIVGILIILFVISLIRHQVRYWKMSRQNVLHELTVLEEEQTRIAADLHDDLCPILSAVKYQIGSVDTIDSDDKETLEKSSAQIDYLAARLREISRNLVPTGLTGRPLKDALEEFFDLVKKSSDLEIRFTCDSLVDLDDQKRINCYRIIQEITHNVIKHAEASTLAVQLTKRGKALKVLCEDNGKGFCYQEKLEEAKGIGLKNISRRASIISTGLHVKSVQGRGTQYLFEIPLIN